MSNTFSGLFLLIVGPSGVGKGTTISLLKKRHPTWYFPISATTRRARPHERDGETYHFLSMDAFDEKIRRGEFLEWAWVHGKHKYGVLRSEVFPPLKQGKLVVREVDIQGFLEIQKHIPKKNLLSFFLLPPPWKVLEKRIRSRAPISESELQKRKESMEKEVQKAKACDVHIQTEDGNIDLPAQEIENYLRAHFSHFL